MAKLIRVVILAVIITALAAKPVNALMADVFEVSSEGMSTENILKGDVFRQSFVSQSDDFGIISVRFSNNNRINDDYLIFRIKEAGWPDWYYENKYKVDQFQDGRFFTFGFPPISQTNGKTYIFELESENGTKENSVSIYLTKEDVYQEGEAFKNRGEVNKDLSFKIVKEAPAIKMIRKDFSQKLKQDPVFFALWGILLLSLLAFCLKKS